MVERPVAKIKDEHKFLGLAEVLEIKSEPSDEDSFAVVPRYHGPGPCKQCFDLNKCDLIKIFAIPKTNYNAIITRS